MRYWILLGMLLLPVGVEAGEAETCHVYEKNGQLTSDCPYFGKLVIGKEGSAFQVHEAACYAKMREAMKARQDIEDDNEKRPKYPSQYDKDGMSSKAQGEYDLWWDNHKKQLRTMLKHWDQTMKECVND